MPVQEDEEGVRHGQYCAVQDLRRLVNPLGHNHAERYMRQAQRYMVKWRDSAVGDVLPLADQPPCGPCSLVIQRRRLQH